MTVIYSGYSIKEDSATKNMATKQSTIDFILDQLIKVSGISTRKMFGEYALYCEGRVVALVCDNNLYMKITETGKKFVGNKYKEGFAYKGAKASMLIDGDLIEDRDWLARLVVITANSLPLPKIKISRNNKKVPAKIKKLNK